MAHFEKLCQTLLAQVGSLTYAPSISQSDDQSHRDGYEHRQREKMMKRAHNFEKFRKEVRNLCRGHYRAKIHDRDIELEKALKHSKF